MPITFEGFARLLVFALILASSASFAADPNGYTAQYECRAGNANCNVDVVALGQRACDQIIEPTTPWSSINWANDTICLSAGDHTAKGVLTIPQSASGSAGNHKALRYTRGGDTDDDPWIQSAGNQAKLLGLKAFGDYWLIHRLTFPSVNGTSPSPRIRWRKGANNQIYNRLLVEGNRSNSHYYGFSPENCDVTPSRITVQNSVFRNVGPVGSGHEAIAINFPCGNDMRAVNNEIYDWVSHPIQLGRNAFSDGSRVLMLNTVVENNDFYVTSALYTDCAGNFTPSGPCAASESVISTKLRASAGNETKMIHNRVWGTRWTDSTLCCNGTSGQAIGNYDNNDYILFQNNIIMDAQTGINNIADNSSFVGNLFYWIRAFRSDKSAHTINRWNSHDFEAPAYEAYSNSVILAEENSFPPLRDPDLDVQCNTFIDSGAKASGTPLSSSIADYNAFYGTPSFAFNGTNTTVDRQLKLRQNNTNYLFGDVIRLSSNPKNDCTATNDSDCFLYEVTTAGTSASASPTYCTSLGCTTTDGDMVVKAIRGPYQFKRKLRTVPGGENVVIPYASVHVDADEASFCPGEGQTNAVGLRTGIGINDDVAWNGILNADLEGSLRDGTAGALQIGESGTPPPSGDGSGTILREHWTDITGVFVADLTSHPDYPNNPTGTDELSLFEAPVDWADNYGTRIRGYVHPPINGTYTFWIASDDSSELWLSTDENPANKILIASQDGGFTNSREWTKYPSQQSVAISLNAGQKYYIEALQKEGTGGDNVAVGWQLPDGTLERPIPGSRLSPFVPPSSPFPGPDPAVVPGLIEAENFDNGGEGVAYHDVDAGNNADGGAYRTSDVDIKIDQGASNGHAVGWVRAGEWLKYTINVASAGDYTLQVAVAANGQGGTFHVEFEGIDKTGSIQVPDTGGWITWQTLSRTVNLSAGEQVMRIFMESVGPTNESVGNFDYIRLSSAGSSTPFHGTPFSIPGLIENEDFDNGGEGVAYHDVDAGNNGGAYRDTDVDIRTDETGSNGHIVNWVRAGEWLKYSVDVASAGEYTLEVRVAANGEGGTFHVEFDGVDKTGSIQVPDTGGWSNWQIVTRVVNLDAGQQTMRIVMDTVGPTNESVGNLDYVRLIEGTTGADIAYWSLDEGGGTVAADTQGNDALLHGATWTLGLSGSALAFDGFSHYAEIAHRASYLLDEGTVAFWFNSAALSGARGLFSKDANGFGSGGHLSILTDENALQARLQSASATFALMSNGTLQANTWHHAALAFGPEGMRLYLDGQLAASNAYTGGLGSTSGGAGNSEPIALGASTGFSDAQSITPLSNFFAGALDDVRIYGRALSAAEINDLVNQ